MKRGKKIFIGIVLGLLIALILFILLGIAGYLYVTHYEQQQTVYIQGQLDMFHNRSVSQDYMDLLSLSVQEAEQQNEDMLLMRAENYAGLWGFSSYVFQNILTPDVRGELLDAFAQMLRKASYAVGQADFIREDPCFVSAITIQPFEIISRVDAAIQSQKETITAHLYDMLMSLDRNALSDDEIIDRLENECAKILGQIICEQLNQAAYLDSVSMELHLILEETAEHSKRLTLVSDEIMTMESTVFPQPEGDRDTDPFIDMMRDANMLCRARDVMQGNLNAFYHENFSDRYLHLTHSTQEEALENRRTFMVSNAEGLALFFGAVSDGIVSYDQLGSEQREGLEQLCSDILKAGAYSIEAIHETDIEGQFIATVSISPADVLQNMCSEYAENMVEVEKTLGMEALERLYELDEAALENATVSDVIFQLSAELGSDYLVQLGRKYLQQPAHLPEQTFEVRLGFNGQEWFLNEEDSLALTLAMFDFPQLI